MERLKILFITASYPTKEQPVAGVFVREHAKAVQIYDHVVVLHCAGPDLKLKRLWQMEKETDETLTEGIATYRVRYRRLRTPRPSLFASPWSVFQAYRGLVAQGFCPDIIHANFHEAGMPAVLIAKLKRIPVVITEHSSSFPRRLLPPFDLVKAWLAFRWATLVLPVSHALQEGIERYGIRARFCVVPNVVDTALFSPPPHPRQEHHPKRILFVGVLVPVKGVAYLLQATARLRHRDDWHLDIVGNGPGREQYQRMALDSGLRDRITFHGFRPKREVAEFMRQADLLVLPSLFETFAAVAAEALATGIPVLATSCGGPEEFVTDDVGLLVPPGNADALCAGLDYMLGHLHLYHRIQISQYAINRFSPEVVGATLHGVYHSLRPRAQLKGR